ncbi:NADPH:quinone oxidoreductase family protein [Actinospica sp.]|jgi:NADPH2:quinone reductase|uniref:NADPH:quinone oxidoreductase family protein n=1 Tax=Actinospica sp. TaxID=1872142 RepID=UPI002CDD383C|nr:NADPH:quinone oxidoreductase family protein [Actinospica sp.]HWG27010.1 NADPH:quinone oxidoreductase family protein [Actinospica sp.]
MFTGRAWRVVRFGEPGQAAELQELTWDEPSPGQVLVRVRAAGAGFPDLMMVSGHFPLLGAPPFGLGEEAAGEVVAAPAGSRFRVGDRVTGITDFLTRWGGYADFAYLREESTIRIPEGMTDEQAAGFPIGFRTAYAGLVERVPIEPGQHLLVLGAAGSAGAAAVQLGKALGARVIAVAGSAEKTEFALRHGADHALNHRTEDLTARIAELTGGHGIDVIYDPVGGQTAATAMESLARNGRILLIGLASGTPAPLDATDMLMRNYTALGVLAIPNDDAETEAAIWERLATLAAKGEITTSVGTVYDFDDVPHMIAQQGAPNAGKSVVSVTA